MVNPEKYELRMKCVPTKLIPWDSMQSRVTIPCAEVMSGGEYSIFPNKPLKYRGRFGGNHTGPRESNSELGKKL